MAHPLYTTEEARARQTFLALMWAFSYPGRLQLLPEGDAAALIGEALLDLETSFYTPDQDIHRVLMRTGARPLPPAKAAYHFYPALTPDLLPDLQQAAIGTMLNPDEAATLIMHCGLERGDRYRLRGPGVNEQIDVQLAGLTPEFWSLRAHRYPLGWDVLLLEGGRVLGLPRSTIVEKL